MFEVFCGDYGGQFLSPGPDVTFHMYTLSMDASLLPRIANFGSKTRNAKQVLQCKQKQDSKCKPAELEKLDNVEVSQSSNLLDLFIYSVMQSD